MKPGLSANPYIGPRSFQTGEKLYGRDHEVNELTGLLVAERIVLLHSPSGAGKTSLLQAALIPTLQTQGFTIIPIMRVNTELPSVNNTLPSATDHHYDENQQHPPNRYILSALMALEEALPEEQQMPIEHLAQMTLSDYLDQRAELYQNNHQSQNQPDDNEADSADVWDEEEEPDDQASTSDILLIFDQFEEILTIEPTNQDAKTAFFKQVGEALHQGRRQSRAIQHGQRWALFSMREDYIAGLDPYLRAIPTRLKNTFRLDLLGISAARQAIQQPAHRVGVEFSDSAADKLLQDLRRVQVQQPDGSVQEVPGNYVEPVQLQIVCHRLWESLSPATTCIDVESLAALGDVNTTLADYYDSCVSQVAHQTGVRERAIREWFGAHLVTPQGIRGQVLQGASESEGLPNHVIRALVDTYLVRAEKRRGATWFELSHDRLIEPVITSNTAWFERNLSMFQRQATVWDEQHRPEGMLLHGNALAEAEQWATEHADELTPVEEEFLQQCREQRRQEQQREAERQRKMRIAWMVAAGMAVLLLIAVAATIFAIQQREVAEMANAALQNANVSLEQQVRVIESQRLSYASKGVADTAPETSLLLAYEALQANQSPFTAQTLRDALDTVTWHTTDAMQIQNVNSQMNTAAFSPDGMNIAGGFDNGDVQVWDLEGKTVATCIGHTARISWVAFSPDGSRIVTASEDMTSRVWDATDGTLLLTLEGHTAELNSAAFHPDGTHILTTSQDQTAQVWDEEGHSILTIEAPDAVMDATFTPDGEHIVIAVWDGTASVLTADGEPVTTLEGHTGGLNAVSISPDGNTIATMSVDWEVRLWHLDGTPIAVLKQHTETVRSATFVPEIDALITTSTDHTARLWSMDGTQLALLQGHTAQVLNAAYYPQNSHTQPRIITIADDGVVRTWVESTPPLPTLDGHTAFVRGVAFSLNGDYLVTVSDDTTARIWNPDDGTQLAVLEGHTDAVKNLDISPDGEYIVTGSDDTTARVWKRDGTLYATLEGHTDTVKSLTFSPDGQHILTASQDTTARVWNLDGSLHATLEGHTDGIWFATISPDGQYIATAATDNTARIWSIDGDLMATLEDHTDWVLRVAFSPDGQNLVTVSLDGTVKIWSIDGTLLKTLEDHTDWVVHVAFSPDGHYFVTSSNDTNARVWKADGTPHAVLAGHTGGVVRAFFDASGQHIATASWDGTARIWDIDGTLQATLKGHTAGVVMARFSPDENRVVTASEDGTARQYLVNMSDVLAVSVCRVGRGLTDDEQQAYDIETPHFDFEQHQCPPVFSWQTEAIE